MFGGKIHYQDCNGQKTNEAFTGLERHGGKVINDKIIISGWSIPLNLGVVGFIHAC